MFEQIMDHYLSRMWCRRRFGLCQGKNREMRGWQLMAGWPSLGMHSQHWSPISPEQWEAHSGALDGSCGGSGGQGSSYCTGPRPEKREGSHTQGIPANLAPPVLQGTHTVSTCSPSGMISPFPLLRGGTQSNGRGSSLLNWPHFSGVLRPEFRGSFLSHIARASSASLFPCSLI